MTSQAGNHIRLAAEAQVISCSASRCITARERRRALQVRVDAGADGARPGSFGVLYRTTQPDIAVQDTERWTHPTKDLWSSGTAAHKMPVLVNTRSR